MGNEVSIEQTNVNARRVVQKQVRLGVSDGNRLKTTIELYNVILAKLRVIKAENIEMYESSTYSSGNKLNISESEWVNKYMQDWRAARGYMANIKNASRATFTKNKKRFNELTATLYSYEIKRASLWKDMIEYTGERDNLLRHAADDILTDVERDNVTIENVFNSVINSVIRDTHALEKAKGGKVETLASKWGDMQRENKKNQEMYFMAYKRLKASKRQLNEAIINYHTIKPPYTLDLKSINLLLKGTPNEKMVGYEYVLTLLLREILFGEKNYTTNKLSGDTNEMVKASLRVILE